MSLWQAQTTDIYLNSLRIPSSIYTNYFLIHNSVKSIRGYAYINNFEHSINIKYRRVGDLLISMVNLLCLSLIK